MINQVESTPPDLAASKAGMRRRWKVLLALIVLAFVAVLSFVVLFYATTFSFEVEGDSMLPTLHTEARLLVSTFFTSHPPKRGDLIVFEAPIELRDFIKRVVALPGETVEIRADLDPIGDPNAACGGCGVYIDGVRLDEPYMNQTADYDYPPMEVPEGTVFVLGDNRRNSSDSHIWGPPDDTAIRGKAFFQYWPDIQFLSEPSYP